MANTRSSRFLSPFVFSDFARYYTLAFFGLAILAKIVDNNAGRDFPSHNNIVFRLASLLSVIYFFWFAIDTFLWIVRSPNEFLKIAKSSRASKKGVQLLQNPSNILHYYFFCFLMLLMGTLALIGTINLFTG